MAASSTDSVNLAAVPDDLIVGTMCHCDDPDECDDHWQFFTHTTMSIFDDGQNHVARGRTLTGEQMRAIATVVKMWCAAAEATDNQHAGPVSDDRRR